MVEVHRKVGDGKKTFPKHMELWASTVSRLKFGHMEGFMRSFNFAARRILLKRCAFGRPCVPNARSMTVFTLKLHVRVAWLFVVYGVLHGFDAETKL